MSRDTTVIAFRQPDNINDPLTELAREGARRMLAQVLFAEADAFVAMWKDLKLPDGRDRIVRHGHGPDRTIQTGVGPVEVRRAKVRDRQGKRKSASARRSSILPSRRNSRLLRIPAGAHATAFFTVRRRRSRFEIIRNPARNGSARRARTQFRAKDGSDEPPAPGRNGERHFHNEKRSNETHASTTDPDARLYRKGSSQAAKLSYRGHVLMENRHGLVAP